jgi:hypothetical protein
MIRSPATSGTVVLWYVLPLEQPERQVGRQLEHADPPCPSEVGRGVTGVDQLELAVAQVQSPEQRRREALALGTAAVGEQRVVGHRGLVEEGGPVPPGVAQAADAQRRRQRAVHTVPDGVRHRQVQLVTAQAVVEGVPADGLRRLQPRRQRERPRLAGVGRRQQPPLDLADRLNNVLRCPRSYRSVCRRLAMTT